MGLKASDLAARLEGSLEGDGTVDVVRAASLSDAGPGDISFLANPRYAAQVQSTRASVVIVGADWAGAAGSPAVIRVANPDEAFARVALWLAPPAPVYAPGVHPTAVVAADAVLGRDVSIGPLCVIESGACVGDRTVLVAHCVIGRGAMIGPDCRLYPLVSVREDVRIGARVIIHNGAVVGSDGFGYVPKGGRWVKIPQVGTVVVGDDVEIGANTTIDRARFGETRIGDGAKLDNLVQVAHNVTIGAHSAVAAQVAFAGSVTIGRGVRVGGQAAVSGHLTVGDGAVIGGQAGVTKDVPAGVFVSGYPAMPHEKTTRLQAYVGRLPKLRDQVADLEKRIVQLEGGLKDESSR